MNRVRIPFIGVALGLVLCFTACDETEVPIPELNIPTDGQAVLVEDFTGVSCQNCPEGARLLDGLKAQLGADKLISIAAYTDFFDQPHPESRYDLHGITEDDQALQEYLGTLQSKPAAVINRRINPDGNNRFYGSAASWQNPILEGVRIPARINMTFDQVFFDESTRELTGEFVAVVADEPDFPLKYTVLLVQDSIVDPQKDLDINGGWILDYVHNNVLMDVVTDAGGDVFTTDIPVTGDILRQGFSVVIPDEDEGLFLAKDMSVIAFVHYNDADRKDVLNVIKTKVVQD